MNYLSQGIVEILQLVKNLFIKSSIFPIVTVIQADFIVYFVNRTNWRRIIESNIKKICVLTIVQLCRLTPIMKRKLGLENIHKYKKHYIKRNSFPFHPFNINKNLINRIKTSQTAVYFVAPF